MVNTWEKYEKKHNTLKYNHCVYEIIDSKYSIYWIDLLHDFKNSKYIVSFFGTPIFKKTFESPYSAYRFIYKIAIELLPYNRMFISDFLKSNDYL